MKTAFTILNVAGLILFLLAADNNETARAYAHYRPACLARFHIKMQGNPDNELELPNFFKIYKDEL